MVRVLYSIYATCWLYSGVLNASAVLLGVADVEPISVPADHLNMVNFASLRMEDTKRYKEICGYCQRRRQAQLVGIGQNKTKSKCVQPPWCNEIESVCSGNNVVQANMKDYFSIPVSLSGVIFDFTVSLPLCQSAALFYICIFLARVFACNQVNSGQPHPADPPKWDLGGDFRGS